MSLTPYRRYIIRTFIICLSAFNLTFCSNAASIHKPDFVYIENKTFKLNGKDFYPMVLNYGAELMMKNSSLWVRPAMTGYEDKHIQQTKESALLKFKSDMQMIKDLGFNAIRLYGIAEYQLKDNIISKYADIGKDTVLVLEGENLTKYMNALADVFKILDEIGLRAIVL